MKQLIEIKRIVLIMWICSMAWSANAQDVGASTLMSQSRSTKANVGNCDITISYHSPQVRDRKIFGGIVPFDFVVDDKEYSWRAGSNQRTTIEFSHDVEINGQSLAAGSYGFVIFVEEKEWTLIFSEGKTWGSFSYTTDNDVLRVKVPVINVPFQEWLSYEFNNPQSESVDIALTWEKSRVVFTVTTSAAANILADLSKVEEKTTSEYRDLALALLAQDSSNIDKAIDAVEKSIEMIAKIESEKQRFHIFHSNMLLGDLLVKKGERKKGEKIRNEYLPKADGFDMYYYALRKYTVEGKKKLAFQLLSEHVKSKPENYPSQLALGEYYLKENNQAKATEHFKKAYELNLKLNSKAVNYTRYMYLQNKTILDRM